MHDSFSNPSLRVPPRIALLLALVSVIACSAFAKSPRTNMPRGQKHESRREIDQLEEVWRDAILKGNIAALDALLADDYVAITASGTLQTKEQALANLRSGRTHLSTIDVSDRKVRFYGKTALVTSLAHVQGTIASGDISGSFRYTRVYVHDSRGKWKIVSFEASRIRQSDERK